MTIEVEGVQGQATESPVVARVLPTCCAALLTSGQPNPAFPPSTLLWIPMIVNGASIANEGEGSTQLSGVAAVVAASFLQ